MNELVTMQNLDQLNKIEQEKIESERKVEGSTKKENTAFTSSLANYIRSCWEKAKSAKSDTTGSTTDKLLNNLRAFKNEYTPTKLAQIESLGGVSSKVYLPVTNIKCRAGIAWVKEYLIHPTEIPWDIIPTPIPELPDSVKEEILGKISSIYQNMMANIMNVQQQTGQPILQEFAMDQLRNITTELKKEYTIIVNNKAKEAAERFKKKLQDQFLEGGFYDALGQAIHDLFIYQAAFIKGPIYRKEKVVDIVNRQIVVSEKIIPFYERRSPFDIYPSPDSSGINDGYLIDKISLIPRNLYELIGIEGFKEDAIRDILNRYESGGLTEWTTEMDERADLENKQTPGFYGTDKIDALEFWGWVKGSMLLDWGLSKEEIDDPDKFYSICAWLVENTVIKAMLNFDPLGKIPYSKASFLEIPGSFWGISPPDILEGLQSSCNALARAIINNSVISSGPIIERNKDRIPAWESKTIVPFRMIESNESNMVANAAPALRFYQHPLTATGILQVLQAFLKLADELSGIPAYAHGDVTVGGAGRTASGLSMLTSNANRGIKDVIKNIDTGIIEDIVKRQYYLNILNGLVPEEDIPDIKIVAKGSIALQNKELQTVRMNEFLTTTANPVDLNILGNNGRKFLLEEIAKANGLDVDKLFPDKEIASLFGSTTGMETSPVPQMPGQGTPSSSKTLSPAGQPISGQNIAMFSGQKGR